MVVGQPDEGYAHGLAKGDSVGEQGLVMAVGFPQLPFHTVAVYRMLESTFRNADENGGGWKVEGGKATGSFWGKRPKGPSGRAMLGNG